MGSQPQEQDLQSQLKKIIKSAEWYGTLSSIQDLELPDCWVAGGAIRNTVWKALFGSECRLTIKDLDVVFFDRDSGRERELQSKQLLEKYHPGWIFDVKNQASFGVWRQWSFVFTDTVDGIAHFLHTATANGVRLNSDGDLEICSPYGLEDLFSGVIRTTPFRHGDEAVRAKQDEYLSKCPPLLLCP